LTINHKIILPMRNILLGCTLLLSSSFLSAQTLSPAVTSWLQNTTGIMGSHYVAGNSTAISDGVLANCQTVQFSPSWVYVTTHGIPAYTTGPFQDGNPSLATDQSAIYKISLNPQQNTGTATATTGGNIGIFINGVSLFDYRDGVAWNTNTNALCGGPGNTPCPGGMGTAQAWNRDAIPAENAGFDCSKGHPANGNYHHHQNPSAFNLDLNVISTVCNLYAADGLYTLDSTAHSPLLGFAYDGFPIYGAYAFKNADGTGEITRMKSGYSKRNITVRTHHADGTDVADGPAVSTTYPLGYWREDYEFIAHPGQADYLDIHNGRFCITPEYPNGTYCYFTTVDEDWNSAYPYVVGPTFYGTVTGSKVTTIGEAVTTYTENVTGTPSGLGKSFECTVFPNPGSEIVAIQINGAASKSYNVELFDISGKLVMASTLKQGSTISYLDIKTLYNGQYFIKISSDNEKVVKPIIVSH
jgi:hypothetical protein